MRKVLGREFTIEIGSTAIAGLKSIAIDTSETDAETTDFDSGGWAEHLAAERSATVTLSGLYVEDADSGTQDEGQAAVEALAILTGESSLETFTITSPGGITKTFSASAQVSGPSGGTNDAATWGAVLKVSGAIETGST
jgi:hypothetical protein